MKLLLDSVLAVLLIATTSAFLQSTTRRERIPRRSATVSMDSKQSSTEAIQPDESICETKNGDKIKSASFWSMELDWTLQDAVPKFTIFSKEHTATFWHSLQTAHSEFKEFSEPELEERYMYLLNKSEREQRTNALPTCGSSPPLLSEWWIFEEKNIIGGILPNGSTTWFPISRGGFLQHQCNPPIDVAKFPDVFAIPGGYVVSRDGIIYEIGHASKSMSDMKDMMAQSFHAPTPSHALNHAITSTTMNVAHTMEQLDKNTRKVILGGIVGSGVLSGVLAFTIGTQFAASPAVAPITAPSESALLSASSATPNISLRRSDSTITEQRIVQELRVVREKKSLQTLQDRLKQDEKVLWQLQREETRQEGAALGFY